MKDHSSQREEVWYALSDLYLDDDIGTDGYKYIARVLAETALSLDELESILFTEVHPALCWNLMQVAGHWGDFGKEWTVKTVMNSLNKAKPQSWLQRLRESVLSPVQERLKPIIIPAWQEIRSDITQLRSELD